MNKTLLRKFEHICAYPFKLFLFGKGMLEGPNKLNVWGSVAVVKVYCEVILSIIDI